MFGYHGKILRVDLTERKVEVQQLPPEVYDAYFGGSGIGAKILYEETTPETDPLRPDNLLMAFTGPYTGTPVPSSGRHHMIARSPLTGIFGEANVGGSWGVHFKKTGHDGIVVKGKADHPVYLWIHEDGVEIRDARPIWGKDAFESAEWLKSQTSKKASAAVIGPAGERLAKIASVTHVGTIARAAARTGMGAVMGSKNLKAMVAYGKKPTPIADPSALNADIKALMPHIKEVTAGFSKFGTSGGVENYEKIGNLPIQNWKGSRWDGAKKITGSVLHDTFLKGRSACLGCPIACGRHIRIDEGPYAGLEGEGPEYETLGTMGGECMIDDLAVICKANDLCNRYGLDTISMGAVTAFAMEAWEKGIITAADTDGIELTWGNGDALLAMIEKTAKGEGIGNLLGEGSKRMAEALGHNAIEFAVQVKGLEPSAHDPRRFFSQAISYATSGRGACHNVSWSHPYEMALTMPELGIPEPQDPYQLEDKSRMTIALQDFMTLQDTLVICRFVQNGKAVNVTNMLNWYNMITGKTITLEAFMRTGDRVFTLKRLYNTRLGISRKDDFLPPRFQTLNRKDPELTNQLPPIGRLLNDYYEIRKWNEEGIPTPGKLAELGLENL